MTRIFPIHRRHLLGTIFWTEKATTKLNHSISPILTFHSLRNMSSNNKPVVYITRNIPPEGMRLLESEDFELRQWQSDDPVPRKMLTTNIRDADALLCLLTDQIDEELMEEAKKPLRVVSTMSVGYDHIDISACQRRNIPVGFTPGVLTEATAELTLGLLLTTSRRLVEASGKVKDGSWGTWSPLWMCGTTLVGATVGIVGLGRIGEAVGRRLLPFGVASILYYGRTKRPEAASSLVATFTPDFDAFLAASDFVVVTCALTPETQNMFDANAFKKMKKTAIFINTSRGGLVHQKDLYEALRDGEIGAAGLDVTTPEPLPTDDQLLTLPNCVVLPHVGSATNATRNAMSLLAAKNIVNGLKGIPLVHQVE